MIGNNLMNAWKIKMDRFNDYAQKNLTVIGAGLSVLLVLAGGWYGYSYFLNQKEEAAHTILVDCFAEYEQALQGKAQWADVAKMCQAGYEKFSHTKVAPYILGVEVDALLADHKSQEALEKLDLMIAHIPADSSLFAPYKMKQALLRFDMPDSALHEQALHDLEKLADDSHNLYNDAAQFYLGLYYRNQGDQSKALKVWSKLASLNDAISDKQGQSPWAALAQEKMNGLS